METILQYLLYLHIAAGSLALITGPIAMINQNGNTLHRNSGNIFFYSMSVVFVSSVIIALAKSLVFLLIIAFFSYHQIAVAMRALHLKKLHKRQKPLILDWCISVIAGLFNISLLIWGIWYWMVHRTSFAGTAIVFGLIGINFVFNDFKRYLRKPLDKNHWLYTHIAGMIGGYIATLTAFLVNVIQFNPPIVLWVAPTVILVPFLIFTINKFKRKFNKGKEMKELAAIKIEC